MPHALIFPEILYIQNVCFINKYYFVRELVAIEGDSMFGQLNKGLKAANKHNDSYLKVKNIFCFHFLWKKPLTSTTIVKYHLAVSFWKLNCSEPKKNTIFLQPPLMLFLSPHLSLWDAVGLKKKNKNQSHISYSGMSNI